MPIRSRRAQVALALAAALTLSSCGFLGLGAWHGKAMDDTRDGFETYDVAKHYPPLDEAVTAAQGGEPGQRDMDALVVRTVVAVDPGRSLTWSLDVNGEDEQRIEPPFGTKTRWSTRST